MYPLLVRGSSHRGRPPSQTGGAGRAMSFPWQLVENQLCWHSPAISHLKWLLEKMIGTIQAEAGVAISSGASNKDPACQCRCKRYGVRSPGGEDTPGGGHGNPLQYSFLENLMDRGVWCTTVQGVTQSWTELQRLSTRARTLKA